MRSPYVTANGKRATIYEVFGVDERVSMDNLRAAYKRLCFRWHPDRCEDKARGEANFKAVQQMWAMIGTEEKRLSYDMMLAEARGMVQRNTEIYVSVFQGWSDSTSGTTTTGYTWSF